MQSEASSSCRKISSSRLDPTVKKTFPPLPLTFAPTVCAKDTMLSDLDRGARGVRESKYKLAPSPGVSIADVILTPRDVKFRWEGTKNFLGEVGRPSPY